VRDADVDLYTHERLYKEFGPFAEGVPEQFPARVERELVGERYTRILTEMAKIASYQWQQHLERSALKGFLLYGAVGVGKTTMVKRLTYELCRMMGDTGPSVERRNEVVMLLVDGADIARGRYGDTEEQLRDLFAYARDGQAGAHHRHDEDPMRRTVVLFDDVESLFLTRGSSGAKEWHFSQNSVFFHNIDDLDTAHTIVALTTNRVDLLDEAIVDRFMPYEFGVPEPSVLEQVAREKARLQQLSEAELKPILQRVRAGDVHSIRDVERMVMRAFVDKVVSA
jgi:SpoVK/Ycf46/Vps4 family AAA+-type ATPase